MLERAKILTLDKIKTGENFLITRILDSNVKCLSSRFGIGEGQVLTCLHKTPGGPVILQKRSQEIAFGTPLTKNIQVQLV